MGKKHRARSRRRRPKSKNEPVVDVDVDVSTLSLVERLGPQADARVRSLTLAALAKGVLRPKAWSTALGEVLTQCLKVTYEKNNDNDNVDNDDPCVVRNAAGCWINLLSSSSSSSSWMGSELPRNLPVALTERVSLCLDVQERHGQHQPNEGIMRSLEHLQRSWELATTCLQALCAYVERSHDGIPASTTTTTAVLVRTLKMGVSNVNGHGHGHHPETNSNQTDQGQIEMELTNAQREAVTWASRTLHSLWDDNDHVHDNVKDDDDQEVSFWKGCRHTLNEVALSANVDAEARVHAVGALLSLDTSQVPPPQIFQKDDATTATALVQVLCSVLEAAPSTWEEPARVLQKAHEALEASKNDEALERTLDQTTNPTRPGPGPGPGPPRRKRRRKEKPPNNNDDDPSNNDNDANANGNVHSKLPPPSQPRGVDLEEEWDRATRNWGRQFARPVPLALEVVANLCCDHHQKQHQHHPLLVNNDTLRRLSEATVAILTRIRPCHYPSPVPNDVATVQLRAGACLANLFSTHTPLSLTSTVTSTVTSTSTTSPWTWWPTLARLYVEEHVDVLPALAATARIPSDATERTDVDVDLAKLVDRLLEAYRGGTNHTNTNSSNSNTMDHTDAVEHLRDVVTVLAVACSRNNDRTQRHKVTDALLESFHTHHDDPHHHHDPPPSTSTVVRNEVLNALMDLHGNDDDNDNNDDPFPLPSFREALRVFARSLDEEELHHTNDHNDDEEAMEWRRVCRETHENGLRFVEYIQTRRNQSKPPQPTMSVAS